MPEDQKEQKLKDVRDLLTAGRIEEEKFLEGFKVLIRTLSGDEMIAALSAAAVNSGGGNLAHSQSIKVEVVARAAVSVNSVPLESLYSGPQNILTKDEEINKNVKKRWLVGQWQQSFINKLYDVYIELNERKEDINNNLGE